MKAKGKLGIQIETSQIGQQLCEKKQLYTDKVAMAVVYMCCKFTTQGTPQTTTFITKIELTKDCQENPWFGT